MNEEFQWTVRVTGAGTNHCAAYARRHQIQLGAPISFDLEHGETTALEYFLAAVGGDIVSGLFLRAKRERIELDHVEATVACSLNNPLTFLDVIGEHGDPGIRDVRVTAYISTLSDEGEIHQLWEDTLRKSPMVQTLRKAVALDLSYKVVL